MFVYWMQQRGRKNRNRLVAVEQDGAFTTQQRSGKQIGGNERRKYNDNPYELKEINKNIKYIENKKSIAIDM